MIKVRVPATSANMGPGFDCLGVALNLYNYFLIEEIEEGLIIEGCDEKVANENNLIYISMKRCFEKIGYKYKGIKIIIESYIPASRGLGSSAACIVGGIVGANAIAGGIMNKDEMLQLAAEIEGHPDNVTPALFGGMTTSICEEKRAYYSKIDIAKGLKFCALIPDFKLSTEEARAALPKEISYKDGVFNVGRTSLLMAALISGDFDLIKLACKDRLHQKYRGKLIEDFNQIIEKCESLPEVGGIFLSGAGPTIMAILKEEDNVFHSDFHRFMNVLKNSWQTRELDIDYQGAVVVS